MFYLQQRKGIIDSPCCNNSCRAYKAEKNFLSLKLYVTYPQEKSNCKKIHAYLTDSKYSTCLLKKCSRLQYMSQSGYLWSCERLNLFLWLIYLVSYPPSMTTLRFSKVSLINATLSTSSQFPILSINNFIRT